MGFLKSVRPWHLGLCFIHLWIYCSTHRFVLNGDVSTMVVMYAVLSVALLALFAWVCRATRTRSAGAVLAGASGVAGALHAVGGASAGTPDIAGAPDVAGVSRASGVAGSLAFPSPRVAVVLDAACAALMGLSAVLLCLPLPLPDAPTAVVASAAGGLGVGWAYARWCALYARLDVRCAAPLAFLTMAIGSVLKTVVDVMPPVPAAVVLALAPCATFLCLRRAQLAMPQAPEPIRYYNNRTIGSLARLAGGIAVFSLTTGVIQSLFLDSTAPSLAPILVHHGSEVVLALVMLAWVGVFGRGLDFSRTWRLILVLMGTALIFESHLNDESVMYLLSMVRTAQTFLIVFLFLALADVARHSLYHPMAVFALGWTAYSLPFMLGKAAGDVLVGFGPDATLITSLIVWVLVIVMMFVLDDASMGNRLIFAELNDTDEGETDQDSPAHRIGELQRELGERDEASRAGATDVLSARCARLSEDFGLTPREREILEMLVRGRSKVHIAETFLISENTVRGHVKHIYAKLDVHGKQELLDRVEAVEV